MPTTDLAKLRSVALEVAGEAAELVAWMRTRAVTDVATKSTDTDVVTAGDRASERLIRERLAELRPGEPMLGEEEGWQSGAAAADGVHWVVDPIDGTVNYMYGLPWYVVSVAAVRNGEPVAAAAVEPVSGRQWTAARGLGAQLDSVPLQGSTTSQFELALIGTGFAYSAGRRAWQSKLAIELISRARDVRRSGSAVLDLCSVAAGWLDGYVEHGLQPWDWAGGALIAAEAGARVRVPTADGSDPDGFGADITIAATPGIADALSALVGEVVGR